jgi:hypothetical protein
VRCGDAFLLRHSFEPVGASVCSTSCSRPTKQYKAADQNYSLVAARCTSSTKLESHLARWPESDAHEHGQEQVDLLRRGSSIFGNRDTLTYYRALAKASVLGGHAFD